MSAFVKGPGLVRDQAEAGPVSAGEADDRAEAGMGIGLWTLVVVTFLVQAAMTAGLASNPRLYGPSGMENILDDVHIYQRYADLMLSGEVPYRDFRVEYPPLALPFFIVPAWVSGGTFAGFWMAFGVEMLVLQGANLALMAWWVHRREGAGAMRRRLAWSTVVFLPMAQLSVTRFDLAPAFLAFSAAMAWASGRRGLCGVLASVGVLVKIVPGAVLGPVLADEASRWRKTRLRGSLMGLGMTALGVSAWVCSVGGPGSMRESLRYHLDRGLEVGSIGAGTLMAVGTALHWPMSTEFRFTSTQVVSPGDSWVASLAFPIQAAAILVVMGMFVVRGRRAPLRFAGASLLAFVLFGKVLSPQYLLWVSPFALVVEGRVGLASRSLFLAAAGLTLLLYPWGADRLATLDLSAIVVLNLRNGMLLALWGLWVFGPVMSDTDEPGGERLTGVKRWEDGRISPGRRAGRLIASYFR